MIILGISGGHDANWCIVKDGKLLGAFEKERFTKKRHDSGEIVSFIARSLGYLGLTVNDIDCIATSEPVHKNTEPGFLTLTGKKYKIPEQWEMHTVEIFNKILPAVSIPHHLAHASYARYTSDFDNTSVITWDGGGDFYTEDAYSSTTISSWKDNKLEWLKRIDNSDFGSLWFTYANILFGDGNMAGKLMGLAAYGSDVMVDQFRERFYAPVRNILEGAFTIKNCWPDHFSPPFISAGISWKEKISKDVAYAIQYITEEAGLSMVEKFAKISAYKNLALSGGVALNGYLNTRIRESGFFKNVFVPPSVHDGGIAVGCALFATYHVFDMSWRPIKNELAFLGYSYSEESILQALKKYNLTGNKIEKEEAIELASKAILDERIVAWYEGRSEHGPRALGNRSILALPHAKRSKDILNEKIKFRESFRPIAPVVMEKNLSKYFDMKESSPYMMYIVKSHEKAKQLIPSGLHIDGTARVQTVTEESSLGKITSIIERISGVGCVLNTSFNIRTPIVETPDDAIEAFLQVPIDILYLGGHLIKKSVKVTTSAQKTEKRDYVNTTC